MDRHRPVGTAGEHAMVAGWLDWQRGTVELKCSGLADVDAHRAPIATSPSMSIAGLVSHLTSVERGWLEGSFLGDPEIVAQEHSGGWDVAGRSMQALMADYRRQGARSRQILGAHDLDELEVYAPPGLELVSLRWIVTHLIEETGRHLGHLDLLREMADGSRGQ